MNERRKIPFNKPFITGNEFLYMEEAVRNGKLSGNGAFTRKCQSYFEQRWKFPKCLLTSSCSDALEMAALLLDIRPGDEVIMPSFTFVSTANAFVLHGARIVFVDSTAHHPNMDVAAIDSLITPRTRAIVTVHYAGTACDMAPLMEVARRHKICVVEDAAQAINGYYCGKPLGSFGDLATFSFHETKNVICGEGGLLVVNNPELAQRAEIISEKGTNRAAFFRGEVDKYTWVDVGSSFLPSELTAAFLWAQLENLDRLQEKRLTQWHLYAEHLTEWALENDVQIPCIPHYATHNGHIFYLVFASVQHRTEVIKRLRGQEIMAPFHYQALHASPFYRNQHDGRLLIHAIRYSDGLLRLPLFYELSEEEIARICALITSRRSRGTERHARSYKTH